MKYLLKIFVSTGPFTDYTQPVETPEEPIMNPNSKKENTKPDYGKLERVGETLYRNSRNGIYYFQGQINRKKYTQSLGTTVRATALAELISRKTLLGQLDYAAGKMTLAELCERYRKRFQHQKPETVKQKNRALARILADWPTGQFTAIGKIIPSDCDLWLARYLFGIPSRNGYIWLLKDVFAMAVRDRAIKESPATHLKAQRRNAPLRRTPTFEQFETIVTSVRSQKFNGHGSKDSADFLEAQGLLGLGQAELSSLTRADVDLEREQISVVRRKTNARFVIPIYPQARSLVEKVCKDKRHSQKLFTIGNAKKSLKAACLRLDFPLFSQRAFRRMFITRAIERGVDVKVIAEWQSHKDGGKLILDTYSHVQRPHAQRMAQLMT
jgi:integrase